MWREWKRQATDWKHIVANHICDQGLLSRTYKELLNLMITKKPIRNMGRHLTDEDVQMASPGKAAEHYYYVCLHYFLSTLLHSEQANLNYSEITSHLSEIVTNENRDTTICW